MGCGSASLPVDTRGIKQAVPIFAALSDSTRLHLVARLSRDGPQSIMALARDTTISRQAVTKHLRVLEAAALAASRRDGRERIFELRPERLNAAHHYLDQIAHQWDEALDRLEAYVERDRESAEARDEGK